MLRNASTLLGSLGLVVAVGAGVWLDRMPVLDQTMLFIVFQLISVCGMLTAAVWWLERVETTGQRLLVAISALLAWRVSYFPVMVIAGWFATLGERLAEPFQTLPIVIYPVFLIFMFVLHLIAALAAGAIATLQVKKIMPITVPALAMATLVSFTSPVDYTVLPDVQAQLDEPLPIAQLPVENPYFPALKAGSYTVPQQLLVVAAGSIYPLIPHSQWSGTVKGTLEEAFRNNPKASTTARIREHYLAYHIAHDLIGCRQKCT